MTFPRGVLVTIARGKEYYYYQAGRNTPSPNEGVQAQA